MNECLVKYDFYNLPFILANSADPDGLIWVYAVCICTLFECIQPVLHMRTLNFRLAKPLVLSSADHFRINVFLKILYECHQSSTVWMQTRREVLSTNCLQRLSADDIGAEKVSFI